MMTFALGNNKQTMKTSITTALLCLAATTAMAQQTAQKGEPDAKAEAKASINVHGTIR